MTEIILRMKSAEAARSGSLDSLNGIAPYLVLSIMKLCPLPFIIVLALFFPCYRFRRTKKYDISYLSFLFKCGKIIVG